MRAFWAFIAILILASAAYLALGSRDDRSTPAAPDEDKLADQADGPDASTPPPPEDQADSVPPSPTQHAGPQVDENPGEPAGPSTAMPPEPDNTHTDRGEAPKVEVSVDRDAGSGAGAGEDELPSLDDVLGLSDGSGLGEGPGLDDATEQSGSPSGGTPALNDPGLESATGEADPEPQVATDQTTSPAGPLPGPAVGSAGQSDVGDAAAAPALFRGYELVPSVITKRTEGGLVVDERFTILGEGTIDRPYEVTWELLLSAQEFMSPQGGGPKRIPERVAMLDGKHVIVTGNVAFPLMATEADELLVMLNPWDGCCIGVPPTPYDAVEVRLKQPATGQQRYTVYGSLKGRLTVEPYLVGEWLVGLYLMDAAELQTREYGGITR